MTRLRHIQSSRAHGDKIPTATPICSWSNFAAVLLSMLQDVDIQDGGQITGSSCNVAGLPDAHVASKIGYGFTLCIRNIQISSDKGRRYGYLTSEIQDGSAFSTAHRTSKPLATTADATLCLKFENSSCHTIQLYCHNTPLTFISQCKLDSVLPVILIKFYVMLYLWRLRPCSAFYSSQNTSHTRVVSGLYQRCAVQLICRSGNDVELPTAGH